MNPMILILCHAVMLVKLMKGEVGLYAFLPLLIFLLKAILIKQS